MKAKSNYIDLVKAFIGSSFFEGEQKRGSAGVPLPSYKIIKRKKPGVYSLSNDKFAEECIDLDRKAYSDKEKYFRLLEISIKTYMNSFSKKNKTESDEEFYKKLKIFLDENVDKNDRMFSLLFLMGEGVLTAEMRSEIWNQVVAGQLSPLDACEKMKIEAYKIFSKTKDAEVKKSCAKMIVAFQENLTDINEINAKCNFDAKGNSPYYDAIYYSSRSFERPEYVSYRKTLMSLESEESKKQLSQYMGGMYHALVVEANQLYTDNSESETTKANCHSLMTKLDSFATEYVSVTRAMGDMGYHTKKEIPASEKGLLKRVNELEKMGNEINATINQLSADTSSKRWGKIILFSVLILALGAVTMGVGWGVGFSKMVSSIRSDSQFFKTDKDHSDVVKKAREIIKDTNPTKIDLLLLEDFEPIKVEFPPASGAQNLSKD